jgi:flagellar hook-basal body complex protein FliE
VTVVPISAVGGEWSVGSLGALSPAERSTAGPAAAEGAGAAGLSGTSGVSGSEAPSFGGELTNAISSLEQTQQSAAGAAQGLAMGTVSDPESAVVTVQDAQLAMQLASQIRTKATEAAQTIFQTQV